MFPTIQAAAFCLQGYFHFCDLHFLSNSLSVHVSLYHVYMYTYYRPDMTFAVDWALKTKLSIYLSIYLSHLHLCHRPLSKQLMPMAWKDLPKMVDIPPLLFYPPFPPLKMKVSEFNTLFDQQAYYNTIPVFIIKVAHDVKPIQLYL